MRLNGRSISGPNIEYIVLPRNDGDIILKAQAVLDYEEFEKMYPEPKAPQIMRPGGQTANDLTDRGYLKLVEHRTEAKFGYFILKSISVTEGLEFDIVSMNKPETWRLWRDEFKAAGLTPGEITAIQQGVMDANGVNEARMKEARDRFLLTLQTPSV